MYMIKVKDVIQIADFERFNPNSALELESSLNLDEPFSFP